MDVQRKKGILEVCVLAVLKKGPSYGYMIIRELEQCVEVSESTLYPILKRLEQNGSLQTYRQEYNGRMRKYYRLTEEGQQKIDKFLEEWDELQMMYHFVEEQNRMAAQTHQEADTAETAENEEPPQSPEAADPVETKEPEAVEPIEDQLPEEPEMIEPTEDQLPEEPEAVEPTEDQLPEPPEIVEIEAPQGEFARLAPEEGDRKEIPAGAEKAEAPIRAEEIVIEEETEV